MPETIRKACESDLGLIEKMYDEHFEYEKTHTAYTVFSKNVYPTRADAEKALSQDALYVYERGGELMGSIIFDGSQPADYGSVPWRYKAGSDDVCVIRLLMVRPCAAGQGIGTALLSFAEESAANKGRAVIRLDTGAQNTPAASLYKKNGYELAAVSSMNVGGKIRHSGHLFFEKYIT